MNKLTIIGRVGRTPETRTISTGDTVTSFSLAVSNPKRNGEDTPPTWFKISAWGKLGESCQRYLDKGKLCAVVGPVSVSSYEAKDGSTKFSLEVRANEVEFLSPKDQSDADDSGFQRKEEPSKAFDQDDPDSDMPF